MNQITIDDFLGTFEKPKMVKKTPKPATSKITKETRKASYEKAPKKTMQNLVLETLGNKSMTAREVASEMHRLGFLEYPARAIIQPRITELVEEEKLEAVDSKFDTQTKRKVAVYRRVV